MGLFLANPWGLLALGAIPALLVIHALRQRSRTIRTSTLFLIEHAGLPPDGGLRLERLIGSVPLLLQLLAALALVWLLAEPRWVTRKPRQTVAVVLDSSASLAAFREPTRQALEPALERVGATADRTDWHLIPSGANQAPLYAGPSLAALLAKLGGGWRPVLGHHDLGPALATAAGLVPGGRGAVIVVTDRPMTVPETIGQFSVGKAIDNVGFAGGDVVGEAGARRWRAIVTNPGTAGQTRRLRVRGTGDAGGEGGGDLLPASELALEPGQIIPVDGPWPAGAEKLVLELSPDAFAADDRLALVDPEPRRVAVAIGGDDRTTDVLTAMFAALPAVDTGVRAAEADIVVGRLGDAVTAAAVLAPAAAPEEATPAPLDGAAIAATDHPLVVDLGWSGLLSPAPVRLDAADDDETLVWKGDRPLIVLRRLEGGAEQLLLAFDVAASTAPRLPALVVLLGRFADRIRATRDRPWRDNFQVGQPIDLPSDGTSVVTLTPLGATATGTAATTAESPFRGRAPDEPGLFTVGRPGGPPVLVGAAHAADARESDFRAAAAVDTVGELALEQQKRESIADPRAPLWLAAIALALVGAWGWPAWRQRAHAAASSG